MKRAEVRIQTPCGADWDAMDPRGSARFCGQCDKLVHDLSALGERAARELLQSKPASLCVRYLHDASGEIWFGNERELVPAAGLDKKKRGLAAVALMAAAPVLFQACGGADPYPITYGFDGGQPLEEAGGASGEDENDAGAGGSR